MSNSAQTKVVVAKNDDKYQALQEVMDKTDFLAALESQQMASGKSKADFLIAVKPNIMMAYSREDLTTITDPELVEYLIDAMVAGGFSNIAVVESQNVFGNWFKNRDVQTVSTFFGYSGKNYRIVDLTEEMEPYDYGGRLGKHWAGPTWRDADFRISFAKNKTHISSYTTLTLKNVYGCMPLQNKFKEYHKIREFDWPTIEALKHFPCHFGFIDAFWSADGLMGFKADYSPRHTKTIIGGENIIAVEWVGATKMGIDPHLSRIFALATTAFGLPEVDWQGDKTTYDDWVNMPDLIDKMMDVGEEYYTYSNWLGFISSDMDPAFPPKIRYRSVFFVRRIMKRILRLLSRFGL